MTLEEKKLLAEWMGWKTERLFSGLAWHDYLEDMRLDECTYYKKDK